MKKVAIIDEDLCVGCARCLPACPVDSIIGTQHALHTVLLDECIGCGLCVNPCPMDCISMHPVEQVKPSLSKRNKAKSADLAKSRHKAKLQRLQQATQFQLPNYGSEKERKETIQTEIQAALQRVQQKKVMHELQDSC